MLAMSRRAARARDLVVRRLWCHPSMNDRVHVFAGAFDSRDAACEYTEEQWEPEPDNSASEQEYREWEDRNPSWQMRSDLGDPYLDSDCIETIDGTDRYDYLNGMLTEPGALDRIRALLGNDENILVLIFSEALGGFSAEMKSTSRLKYCGEFSCKL